MQAEVEWKPMMKRFSTCDIEYQLCIHFYLPGIDHIIKQLMHKTFLL